jgi:hypothetical protein
VPLINQPEVTINEIAAAEVAIECEDAVMSDHLAELSA